VQLIHYKGRLQDPSFSPKRLSDEPHYFGVSTAGQISPDKNSTRGDLFLEILNYRRFGEAVPHRIDGITLEKIPPSRQSNFWRDGVRRADADTYGAIVERAGWFFTAEEAPVGEPTDDLTTPMQEGGKKVVYSTRYERQPKLRARAIALHGTSCFACEMSMRDRYGEDAKDYIQVHHKRPLSLAGGAILIDPKTDLAPLCPNCHAIVHLGKVVRSINQVRQMLGKAPIELGE
jgi:putative restriction endonuclease